jgi:hypothetical protein
VEDLRRLPDQPQFGVELGYADFGENTASGVISGVAVNGTAEMTAWDLVGVGSIPFGDRFAAYGKLGFYRGDVDVRATASVPGDAAVRRDAEGICARRCARRHARQAVQGRPALEHAYPVSVPCEKRGARKPGGTVSTDSYVEADDGHLGTIRS